MHPPHGRQAHREEVEVERPVDRRRQAHQLAAVLGLGRRVDVLQRGRLAAEPGPVIDDLEDELAGERVDRRHEGRPDDITKRRPVRLLGGRCGGSTRRAGRSAVRSGLRGAFSRRAARRPVHLAPGPRRPRRRGAAAAVAAASRIGGTGGRATSAASGYRGARGRRPHRPRCRARSVRARPRGRSRGARADPAAARARALPLGAPPPAGLRRGGPGRAGGDVRPRRGALPPVHLAEHGRVPLAPRRGDAHRARRAAGAQAARRSTSPTIWSARSTPPSATRAAPATSSSARSAISPTPGAASRPRSPGSTPATRRRSGCASSTSARARRSPRRWA